MWKRRWDRSTFPPRSTLTTRPRSTVKQSRSRRGDMKYPLAPQGVFRTVQGEGALLGVPMVFIRLAGCSVGCAGCDTDYSPDSFRSLAEIEAEVKAVRGNAEWVFITGGEPADHEL